LIKQELDVPVIFGGIHPTSVPEGVIKNEFVDFIIRGEGEYALLDLVSKLENNQNVTNIPNVWLKKDGKVIKNPMGPLVKNLDSLPFPDKEIFHERAPYITKAYTIMASRGCPFSCTYCSNSHIKKLYPGTKYFRKRSVDNVIEELKLAKTKYNPKWIIFHDEIFTSDPVWLKEFADKYPKEIGLTYFCWVHPATITDNTAQLLKRSGCAHVEMGVQTVSEKTRAETLHRHHTNEQLENAIKLLKEADICITTDNILGLPNQSEEEMFDLARFYSRNKVDAIYIYWLTYYPKTEIIDIALKSNIINHSDVEKINAAHVAHSFLLAGSTYKKEASKIRILIMLSQILRPKMVDWIIRKKIYRFFPGFNLGLFNPFLINGVISRIVATLRKGVHPNFSNLRRYPHFIKHKLFRRNLIR
jgi:radical SAM superfamily enzyme YgiQ (UPF0313 family)